MKPKFEPVSTFYGTPLYDLVIPENDFFRLLLTTVDWKSIRKELMTDADGNPIAYSHTGRPACDPLIIFKMLFLQRYHPASDAKVEKRAKTDLAYRFFLELPIPETIPDESTLSLYRTKWGDKKIAQINKNIFKQIQRFGFASIQGGVTGDTTHQHAHIHKPSARVLILRCFEKYMRELQALDERFSQFFAGDLLGRLGFAVEVWFAWYQEQIRNDELSRKERFAVLIQQILTVQQELTSIISDDESIPTEITSSKEWLAYSIYKTILNQILAENVRVSDLKKKMKRKGKRKKNKNKKENKEKKKRKEHKKETENEKKEIKQKKGDRKIISLVDLDARSGHKSKTKPFTGYKVVPSMTPDGFHPNVETVAGNVSDITQAIPLVEKVIENVGEVPGAIGLDLGFNSVTNRKNLHELGVQPGIELEQRANPRNPKMFSTRDFQLDFERRMVTCPGGQTTNKVTAVKKTETFVFRFPKEVCDRCPLKAKCTSSKTGRTVQFSQHIPLLEKDRQFLDTDQYDMLHRARWRLEGRLGDGKNSHGLAYTPYHGLKKTSLHNRMVFIVLNLKRLIKLLYFPDLKMPPPVRRSGASA